MVDVDVDRSAVEATPERLGEQPLALRGARVTTHDGDPVGRGLASPSGAGARGESNASCMESTTDDSFCASTVEIAYMVVKNANNSVMKSAYDTSQRSWLGP